MNTTTSNWQAPVFFDPEALDEVEHHEAMSLAYSPPVVLPEDATLEAEVDLLENTPPNTRAQGMNDAPQEAAAQYSLPAWVKDRVSLPDTQDNHKARFMLLWLLGSLAILLVTMLVVDAWRFIGEEYTRSWLGGTVFLFLLGSIGISAGWLGWRAWLDVRRLRSVNQLQADGEKIILANGYDHALPYIKRLALFYFERDDLRPRFERFYIVADGSHYHDGEICALFSEQVLKGLDEQAKRVVVKRSNETALLVVLSPNALLSTLLTFWRTLLMVREVSLIYGGRPGFLGTLSLMSLVIQNMLYADVSEMLAESVAETFGSSVLSIVSAQAAQGEGSSLMTARVGIQAMHVTRPMPFLAHEKPHLKEIRGQIINSMRELLGGKK